MDDRNVIIAEFGAALTDIFNLPQQQQSVCFSQCVILFLIN